MGWVHTGSIKEIKQRVPPPPCPPQPSILLCSSFQFPGSRLTCCLGNGRSTERMILNTGFNLQTSLRFLFSEESHGKKELHLPLFICMLILVFVVRVMYCTVVLLQLNKAIFSSLFVNHVFLGYDQTLWLSAGVFVSQI